ncbi:aldose 1-epimerase family protein [Leucobacter albus]|uniref:Aldose 1-epimerase family protein n=1 Tax=Leucobacter albus TaxID=272210 RepID=A0ABW3TKU1_9MICO
MQRSDSPATDRHPSGAELTISRGAETARIVTVGASLASYRAFGRDLVVPFEVTEIRPAFRGATLAPWPNRIPDGSYLFDGEQQLPLTEPGRGHAIHGLVAWLDWSVIEHSEHAVTLATTIVPQPGYPWRVYVTTEYRLGSDGLTQTVTARNDSATRAPFGAGPHPYLVAPNGALDTWELELPAATVLLTDDRLSPRALAEVTHEPERFDFREARRIGAVELDHAFTELSRGVDGLARVRVTDAYGHGAEMRFDERCPWVQVHTADQANRAVNRLGLAVEPMTCAPAAFQSGQDLLVIAPGAEVAAAWTIAPIEPAPGQLEARPIE